MAGIFISYRRGDDPGFSQALFARLEQTFPSGQLFMDVESIAPGLDFVKVIEQQVQQCDVLLAVIGRGWLDATDVAGQRRLQNPDDFVRIEIASALRLGKRVIPVLVNNADMPRADELPDPLKQFARCNAARLTHDRFRADTDGLIKALKDAVDQARAARQAIANVARPPRVEARPQATSEEPMVKAAAHTIAEAKVRRKSEWEAESHANPGTAARIDITVDESVRKYMLRVYNYLAAGIALTGVVAYLIVTYSVTSDPALAANAGGQILALHRGMYLTPLGQTLFATPLMYLLIFAPLAFFLPWPVSRKSAGAAQFAFWLFAAVMGASLSSIFLRYTATSITQVFFVTAASLGALSLYGYATNRDLTRWSSFLFMVIVGIIIAMIINISLQSSALQFLISVLGLFGFAGLTASGSWRVRDNYYQATSDTAATRGADLAAAGALNLYRGFHFTR